MLAVATAMGQATQATNPYSIAIGGAFNLDSTAGDLTSSTGFKITAAYHFSNTGQSMSYGSQADSSIDVSYDSFSGHSNHLSQYAALLTARMPISSSSAMGAHVKTQIVPYYGIGVGIVRNSLSASTTIAGQSGGTTTVSDSGNDWLFAAKALIGVKFSQNLFVEGAYNYNGSVHGVHADNIDVSVGLRF